MKNICFTLMIIMSATFSMAQWSSNPSVNLQITDLTDEQVLPKIAMASNGDYFVGYYSLEGNNYNIRLQRLDNNGNILWQENGLLVSDHPSMSWITDWDMTVDHENHAIITFQDIRNAGNNNIYAYRISPEGEFIWGEDGIELSNNERFEASPKVTVTNSNNSIIAWQSKYNTSKIVIQKISPDGTKLFGESGKDITSATGNLTWPQLLPSGEDDFIMKYYEDTGANWAPTRHLFAQRYDLDGEPVWDDPAEIQTAGTITAWTQLLPIKPDGNGGFYIAWHDNQISGTISSSWIQHVDHEGNTSFTENGLLLSNRNDFNQFNPKFVQDEAGENIYVYWDEVTGDQNQSGIYGQKITSGGALLWGEGGKKIIDISNQETLISDLLPHDNKAVLIYKTTTASNNTFIAQYLDENGQNFWEPATIAFASAQSGKGRIVSSHFNDQYWVFAFEDDRNEKYDIFMQNLYPDGMLGLNSTLTGTVTIENEVVEPQEVEITVGEMSAYPDEDGSFQMTVMPGTYTLTADHPYLQEIVIQDIELIEGEGTTQNFQMLALRSDIQVILEDAEGNPVFPASVNISGPEDTYSDTASETPLEFTGVPYGNYTTSAQSGIAFLETDTVIDENNGKIVITDMEGVFAQDGFISGVVTIEDGMADVSEVSIASGDSIAEIDDEGNYTLTLSPGMHDLIASHPYTTTMEIDQIRVLPGITSSNRDISLDMLRADLNCYVENQDGQIIQNVEAEVAGPEGNYSFTTESLTEPYVLSQVPYGEYTMSTEETGEIISNQAILDENNQDIVIVLHTVDNEFWENEEISHIFPNPLKAGGNMFVSAIQPGSYTLQLVSADGNLITERNKVKMEKGKNLIRWDILARGNKVETGLYFLVLERHKMQTRLPLMIVE